MPCIHHILCLPLDTSSFIPFLYKTAHGMQGEAAPAQWSIQIQQVPLDLLFTTLEIAEWHFHTTSFFN